MRKFAVIGDIHSNMFAFNKVLKEVEENEINEYIFLGDYVLDGFEGNVVLEKVRNLSDNVVYGNKEEDLFILNNEKIESRRKLERWKNFIYEYDRITSENFEYIKKLEKYKILDVYGKKIMFFHGSPFKTRDYIIENDYEMFDKIIKEYDCDVYIMAHTHLCFCVKYKDKLFINPGTVGMPISVGKIFSYGILSIDKNNIEYEQKKIKYDYEELKKYLHSSDYHKVVGSYATLSLCNLKYNENYTNNFIRFLQKEANERNMELTDETPNWFWNECYEKYKEIYPEINDI